ncbi:tyrosine-type recombinase/integrase [Mycobacterium sp. KBS0706]|uniref:tyrosine-type recombinase/integrase n=1 Tax=Mycobacterium sp. KBS0706 TaxID=2578109 RepID=UPI00110FC8F6|nr:tyrosine-type recombinase/integrase [Mycobacterium sp. KBS0706]TSD87560.1 tyrosine-type recombinase/integrase [Mycobacterium sp. KBS0706]
MTDVIEDAVVQMPAAMPWTPPAGPVALSEAKIAEIKALAQKADQLVEASLSENTRIAYGKAWRAWSDWCLGFGLDPTGENAAAAADERWLVMHLTALSEKRSLNTILLRRAAVVAIRKRLKRPLQLDDAEFEAFFKGLRRTKGARPVRKAALLEPNLRAASLVLTPDAHPGLAGTDLTGGAGEGRRALRDMALLLTGFAGGFRRSELSAFDLRDVSFTAEGLVLYVGRSKNDQERHGAEVGIEAVLGSALCVVTALRRWLEVRGDAPGALFCRLDRGGNLVAGADGRMLPVDPATIARLVKRAIARTGVDAGEFSAHSLRAGMMTAADRLGVPFEQAMEHGSWKSYAAARIYRRHESLWTGNFTGRLLADK